MTDFKNIKEKLGSLLNEKTSKEDEKVIAGLMKDIDTAETDMTTLAKTSEDYRNRYIESVKNYSSKDAPRQEVENEVDSKPKKFEDCINEVIENRSEK